ncbi:MAG: hypothetical protein GY857_01475 [Desulfobacula sp.]|nr:hypothetical protein [Desulfobacula sp.]
MKLLNGFIGLIIFFMLISGCISFDKKATLAHTEQDKLANQHIDKGDSLVRAGNLKDALDQYNLALTFDSSNKQALKKKLKVEKGLKKRAEQHYQTGLKFDKRNRPELARKEYLAALQNWPGHEKARKSLSPGKVIDIDIEDKQKYITHVIKPGESISRLAMIYYDDYKKYTYIGDFNHMDDVTKVSIGQKIKIPAIEKFDITTIQSKQETYLKEKGDVKSKPETIEKIKTETAAKEKKEPPQEKKDQKVTIKVEPEPIKIPEPVQEDKKILEQIPEPAIEKETLVKEDVKTKVQESIEKSDEKDVKENEFTQLLNSGMTFFNQRKYDQAIFSLEKASAMDSENEIVQEHLFESHFQNGLALFNKKEYLKASDSFQSAIQYNEECDKCHDYIEKCVETYKNAHYNMGTHYFGKEKLQQAIKEWELVQEIDPEYRDIKTNLKKAKSLYKRLEEIKKSGS